MDDDAGPDDAGLGLAARRKELEREFAEKYRDLKAQDKRRRESLKLEQDDFEAYRRAKGKELADREEKLRRTVENREEKARVSSGSLRELEDLRRQVKESEAGEWRRKKEVAELEARASAAERALAATRRLLSIALTLLAAVTAAWLALGRRSAPGGLVLAGATVLAVVLLMWRRSKA